MLLYKNNKIKLFVSFVCIYNAKFHVKFELYNMKISCEI